MTISGFLPQRWRPSPEIARHAEAIAGILNTAPVAQTAAGPAIASLLGTADVLPYLVAIKSLHRGLGRGRIAIIDDGTLTGEDRAILAHHCGDPEIRSHLATRRGAFPPGGAWALLLTILDRRAGQYWIALDPHTVALGPLAEVEAAVATNRSFALFAAAEATGGPVRRAERRTAVLCGTRGWRYRSGCAGLAGFAAGGAGRALAAAFLKELDALGDGTTADADTAVNLVLANESEAVELPRDRYLAWWEKDGPDGASLVHFPPRQRYSGDAYAAMSARVIAQLAA